jgi:hypothetical protein
VLLVVLQFVMLGDTSERGTPQGVDCCFSKGSVVFIAPCIFLKNAV